MDKLYEILDKLRILWYNILVRLRDTLFKTNLGRSAIMDKKVITKFGRKYYLLGKDKEGTEYWLEEPSWNCNWYWGFGYVQTFNRRGDDINSHQHFDNMFLTRNIYDSFVELLVETPLSKREIWTLLELMKSCYTLEEYAKLCHTGSSWISSDNPCKEILQDTDCERKINTELLPRLFGEIRDLVG